MKFEFESIDEVKELFDCLAETPKITAKDLYYSRLDGATKYQTSTHSTNLGRGYWIEQDVLERQLYKTNSKRGRK